MLNDLAKIYNKYPRQFGKPERYSVDDFSQLKKHINNYLSCSRCYCTIYDYTPQHTNITLDRIAFDFDGEDALEQVRNFIKRFVHYKHFIVFSGGGFHIYIKCKNYEKIKNPKQALTNAHNWFYSEGIIFDTAIRGDIARIFAIPGTYNWRRHRYVVFVSDDELTNSLAYFVKKAEKQWSNLSVSGTEEFDVGKFDYAPEPPLMPEIGDFNIDTEKVNGDKLLEKVPHCIYSMLVENGNWKSRWYVTLWFKEHGFPKEAVNEIAIKYFSKFKRTDYYIDNYRQYCAVRTLDYAYRRNGDYFPNCETLNQEGFCKGKCRWYNRTYE